MEAEEQRKGAEEILYKTKVVQFLGRATPIVLQNDNGPCPLLAIFDFDRCRPLPGGISLAAVREKEKEREEEEEPRDPIRRRAPSTIPIRRHPPSSNATDEEKPRRCHLLFSLSPYTRRRRRLLLFSSSPQMRR
ncbi:hypothetical protein B296_00055788, partial [Ensete ventricosum]